MPEQTQERADLDIEAIEDDLDYYVCEIHDDVALCGEELGDGPTCPPDCCCTIDCPLCALADERGVVCGVDPRCPGRRGPVRSLIHRLTGGRCG